MSVLRIPNKQARRLWLTAQGLGEAPTGPLDVMDIIRRLGFVQLDSICVVERAHHHIVWSRNQNYRAPMLNDLMLDRSLFEHFTHDASVLPMEFYPMWARQFRRYRDKLSKSNWFSSMSGPKGRAEIKAKIASEGALSTKDFDTKIKGPKEMWARPPHKLALDFLWYSGELATCHRDGFTKLYDLGERVFPEVLRAHKSSNRDQLDWLCRAALDRMAMGSVKEIKQFWDAADLAEVRGWVGSQVDLVTVQVQGHDGTWSDAFAPRDIEARLEASQQVTTRLRVINPFDPVIRDRDRLKRLFGFDYRNEIFIPAAKRVWGYYVMPLLEGDRFVGRVEAKVDRTTSQLNITQIWKDPDITWTAARASKVEGEMTRFAKFAANGPTNWMCGAPQ